LSHVQAGRELALRCGAGSRRRGETADRGVRRRGPRRPRADRLRAAARHRSGMSGAHRAGTSGREAEAAAPPTSLPVAALSPGSVALVGGGPGALDLITVRGMQLLQQADVLIVDRLGPAAA